MAKEKLVINYGKKKILVELERCSFLGKGIGLMFSKREKAKNLLFEFRGSSQMGIHSYFVFFDFLAVWLDYENNVVQIDRVKPWVSYLRPSKKYAKLVEIPINKKNKVLVSKLFG